MTLKRAPSSGRGVARGLAVAIGIPPQLAVPAGERAVAAMMALKQGRDAGGGALRQHHLVRAQQHIAALDPTRHGALMQHLHAHVLALQGRGGDTRIAHVSPGEVVVPKRLQTPEIAIMLQRVARERGVDPARLRVGSGRNAINPYTGQMEFDDGEYGIFDSQETPISDVALVSSAVGTAPPPSNAMPDEGVEGITVEPHAPGAPAPRVYKFHYSSPAIPDSGPLPPKAVVPLPPEHQFTPVPPPLDTKSPPLDIRDMPVIYGDDPRRLLYMQPAPRKFWNT